MRRPGTCGGSMSGSGNPLDLNNLPEDHNSSSSIIITTTNNNNNNNGRRRNRGGRDHNVAEDDDDDEEEVGKVYECRFCSLKFCKSQALGGHMNRHRQERETETLNRARQLVLNNDGAHILGYQYPVAPPAPPTYHSGGRDPLFRQPPPPLNYQSTNRLFTSGGNGGSSSPLSAAAAHPPPPYLYPSPPRTVQLAPYHQPPSNQYSNNDYYIGHVLNPTAPPLHHTNTSSYTCIGAPVVGSRHHRVGSDGSGGSDGGSLISNNSTGNHQHHQAEEEYAGLNWGRSYAA